MRIHRIGNIVIFSVAIAMASMPLPATAQTWPTRPVTVVLPYQAGGPTDVVARLVAQKMTEFLGQTVLVENVPGANTSIGATRVARSPADGYTLLIASLTTLSLNPSLYKKASYKADDFTPISLMVKTPMTMTVAPTLPAQNLQEFVAYAKMRQGQVFNGMNPGRGNTNELLGELLNAAAGIKVVSVPYKGLGAALTAVMSGEIHIVFDAVNTTIGALRGGKVRVLAITSEERSPILPDVPTFKELGYPSMTAYFWYGLVAPNGTPRAIIDRLNAAMTTAFRAEDVRSRLAAVGITPEPSTPRGMADIIRHDAEMWGRVIKSLGIELE